MKKHLLKLFLIMSVTGNVATLLFYVDPTEAPDSESNTPVKNHQARKVELSRRLRELSARTSVLQDGDRKTQIRIEDLSKQITELKERASGQVRTEPTAAAQRSARIKAKGKLSREEMKDRVKKALLSLGELDENGRLKEASVDDFAERVFIRKVLPFLSQGDVVFESIMDVLADDDLKGFHELSFELIRELTQLFGMTESVDQSVVDALTNNDLSPKIRGDLLNLVDFDQYGKDSKLADKLLNAAQNASDELRASILFSLGEFDLENVSAIIERIAFDKAEDLSVRRAAIGSLGDSKDYTRDFMGLLGQKDAGLRAAALSKLVGKGVVPGLRERIHSLVKSETDFAVLSYIVDYLELEGDQSSIIVLQGIEDRASIDADLRNFARNARVNVEKRIAKAKAGKE
ncbi:MAG: hypothetical protein P1V97_21755 [Planctomycetota bacterium]|nr:hypothetical protein [Planctomycetota bacterium]